MTRYYYQQHMKRSQNRIEGYITFFKGYIYAFKEDLKKYPFGKLYLRNGIFPKYVYLGGDVSCISEEWKDIIEPFVEGDPSIEFIPVEVISEEYGNRTYYLVFIEEDPEIVDYERSKYICGDRLTVPCLRYEKVKNLNLFGVKDTIFNFIISKRIYKLLKDAKLTNGLEFNPVTALTAE